MPRVFHGRRGPSGDEAHSGKGRRRRTRVGAARHHRGPGRPGCTSGGRLDDKPQEVPIRRAFTCDATVLGRAVRVVFGAGTLAQVAPEARTLGSRVLLVAGRHEDEPADRVSAGLGGSLVGQAAGRDPARACRRSPPLPSPGRARSRAEVLVAIGGGSATGLAKAVALRDRAARAGRAHHVRRQRDDVDLGADRRVRQDHRAGPAGAAAHRGLRPGADRLLPADTTAASGMNALAHALEAGYAPDATPRLGELAQEALRPWRRACRCRRRGWRPRRPGPRRCTAPGSPAGRSAAPRWGCTTSSPTSWAAPTGCRTPGSTARCSRMSPRSTLPPRRRPSPAAARALGVDRAPTGVAPALFDLATRLGAPTSLAGPRPAPDAVDDVAAAVAASAWPTRARPRRRRPAPPPGGRARPAAAHRPTPR